MDFSRFVGGCGRLSFVYPGYIFYHALSLFTTLSGPSLSLQVNIHICFFLIYIPESVRRTLKVFGSHLGEVERGRVREGEGGESSVERP